MPRIMSLKTQNNNYTILYTAFLIKKGEKQEDL